MKYLLYILPVLLVVCTGCSPEVPPPPVERNDLVVRFFRSLRNNSSESAALQGQKIYAMDKRNYFVQRLVAVQQANNYIRQAQRALNAGDLKRSIKELESGLQRFPNNNQLHTQLDKLRKLRHAERHFIAMRSAPNPVAMNSALAAAQAGLEGLESPKLTLFFTNYKRSIERWNKHNVQNRTSSVQVPIRSFDDK
ncbi:MAG: hypothetical protein IKD44_11495 [Lentisphaeria bacterium]|nr:hypothetical protein [Lentisphaeria bacterium]